jgi:TruD family tRNA pseudouridine synthase
MAGSHAEQSLFDTERETTAAIKAERPELFAVDPHLKGDVLAKVGIGAVPANLPEGYIRHSPLDFVVEEIAGDGTLVEAVLEPERGPEREGEGTVYADMVKIGISTLDAVERVATGLGTTVDKIRYAGIKDAVAVTAQRISMRGVALESALALDLPGVRLKNIAPGKGALNVGDLQGNRFTLFIRTTPDFATGPQAAMFEERLAVVARDGVRNFYGTQRYGSPRFLAHYFGLLLCKGDLAGLAQAFLTLPSPTEIPYVAQIRAAAAQKFGDWKAVKELMVPLPYTFRFEHLLLDALIAAAGAPDQYMRAASALPAAQTNMWVKAYASYLANQVMSSAAPGALPESIPLLSGEPESQRFYEAYLAADGAREFQSNLRKLPFIVTSRAPRLDTVIRPRIHGARVTANGVGLSFDLPKGAYATTVLMNLFNVITKSLLGTGSLEAVRTEFAAQIEAAAAAKKGEADAAANEA